MEGITGIGHVALKVRDLERSLAGRRVDDRRHPCAAADGPIRGWQFSFELR